MCVCVLSTRICLRRWELRPWSCVLQPVRSLPPTMRWVWLKKDKRDKRIESLMSFYCLPECSQDDQRVHGQEIWQLVARGDRWRLWLWGHARGEEPSLHVLRWKSGRVCMEVLVAPPRFRPSVVPCAAALTQLQLNTSRRSHLCCSKSLNLSQSFNANHFGKNKKPKPFF